MTENRRLDEGQPNGGAKDATIAGRRDESVFPEQCRIEQDVEHRSQCRDWQTEYLGPTGEKNLGAFISLTAARNDRGGFCDLPPGEQQIDQKSDQAEKNEDPMTGAQGGTTIRALMNRFGSPGPLGTRSLTTMTSGVFDISAV